MRLDAAMWRIVVGCVLIAGCDSPFGTHGEILRRDIKTVSYDNGISITEGKIVADAYIYIHGGELGKAPHVRVRDGGEAWLGDIYTGFGVTPIPMDVPPVSVNKATGEANWAMGPSMARIVPGDIKIETIEPSRSVSGDRIAQ